jgi:hypothetical protein
LTESGLETHRACCQIVVVKTMIWADDRLDERELFADGEA